MRRAGVYTSIMDELILFWGLGGLLGLAGLGLLGWALFYDRAKGRKRCPKCWYDMSHASEVDPLRCPECGHQVKRERRLLKTRRKWCWAAVGVVLIAGMWVAGKWPDVRADGWNALVPNTTLILAMPYIDSLEIMGLLSRRLTDYPEDKQALWQWQWRLLRKQCVQASTDGSGYDLHLACSRMFSRCPDPALVAEMMLDIAVRTCGETQHLWMRRVNSFLSRAEYGTASVDRFLPRIIELLDQEDPQVVREALRVISFFGSEADDAYPHVLLLVDESYLGTRAMSTLLEIGHEIPLGDAAQILELSMTVTEKILLDIIGMPETSARGEAIQLLGLMRPMTLEIEKLVVSLFEGEGNGVRLWAILALSRFPRDNVAALETLLDEVNNEKYSRYRENAITALGKLRPQPPDRAIALLTSICTDSTQRIHRRGHAIRALAEFGDADVVTRLGLELIRDQNQNLRRDALSAMFKCSALDDDTKLSVLKIAAEDVDPYTRIQVCYFFYGYIDVSKELRSRAQPVLRGLLNDPVEIVRDAAREALGE